MISLAVAAVLLLIHALVCLVLWTLMKLGLLPVRGHMLAVMVLVPLWEIGRASCRERVSVQV